MGKMMRSPTLLHYLMVLFCFHSVGSDTPLAPALYAFGDSLFDSGNNNFLPTVAKANFQPYGVDFVHGVTGRFTNGRTVADFVAEYLKLPFSPPYLSTGVSMTLTGLNFASGSCGILPETGSNLGKCLSLDEQLDMFQHFVETELPKHFKGSKELLDYLSKSMIMVSVGSNDYINNYLEPNDFDTSRRYPPQPFAQVLTDVLSQSFQRLYKLGARKIVMFEIGPIGCIPSIARATTHNGQCIEETNQLVSYFNQRLGPMLNNLQNTLIGSSFVLGRVNGLGYDAIANPTRYGLADTSSPCCTTWANGTSACIPFLTACPTPQKHFFWDAFHLTETACFVIASRCINDSSICTPMSISQLAQL